MTLSTIAGCNANTRGVSGTYGPREPTITLRNKLAVGHFSYNTAPNAPVVHAVGLGGFRNGVDIGANCSRLYVDFNKPVVLVNMGPTNNAGTSGHMSWLVPWDKAFMFLELYIQAAWADPKTKALSLASAEKLTLPGGLPLADPPRHRTVYSFAPHYLAALTIVNTNAGYVPSTQYVIK